MVRRALLLVLIFSGAGASAGEAWLFLTDGKVGWGNLAANPVSVRYPDGTEATVAKAKIRGHRTRAQMSRAVDAMLSEMGQGLRVAQHAKRFQVFKCAAADRLIEHVKKGQAVHRLSALFALQYCWVPEARDAVVTALQAREPDVRKVALTLLTQKLKRKELAALSRKFAASSDLGVAASVFWLVTQTAPDLALARRLLRHRKYWPQMQQGLPFYHAPSLSAATRVMVTEGRLPSRNAAIVGLIHQNDNSQAARALVSRYLIHPTARLRELAAEYLTWHGNSEDVAALKAAGSSETDPYTRASVRTALAAINHRRLPCPELGVSARLDQPNVVDFQALSARYRKSRETLVGQRSPANLKAAWMTYVTAESHEPWWCYGTCELQDAFRRRCTERLALQALLFGIPHDPLNCDDPYKGKNTAPTAATFMPPVRQYLDPKRKSYGFHVSDKKETFANSVHVGDDVGWKEPHQTVVAIGDGIVRSVLCSHSWGYKVVIEHRLPSGDAVCSLYAHLSPFVHVKVGEVVRMGTKIGSIGRSNTWENGGYGAHLHFGIHSGPYTSPSKVGDRISFRSDGVRAWGKVVRVGDGRTTVRMEDSGNEKTFVNGPNWICGYIDPSVFKQARHGWLDPQRFFREQSKTR